ncbi:rabgap/tbc domain-containing protein [Anaeramoeba flamelloides]|uniref:Rabgap/tbc domain-containing protein n=1 Tax=Anaeramoeba flamelloides TaxID=1746091 RepID=A0ABQ8X4Z8_9EUKA|nr:rabgap/tbc domain-containing protein [Anaeramoeba flamelloides]
MEPKIKLFLLFGFTFFGLLCGCFEGDLFFDTQGHKPNPLLCMTPNKIDIKGKTVTRSEFLDEISKFDPGNKANLMINVQGIDLKELQSSSTDSYLSSLLLSKGSCFNFERKKSSPTDVSNLLTFLSGLEFKDHQINHLSSLDRQEFPISSKSIVQTLSDRYANRKIRTFSVSSSIGIALASASLPLSTNLTNLSNLPNDNVYFIESLNPDKETFQNNLLNDSKIEDLLHSLNNSGILNGFILSQEIIYENPNYKQKTNGIKLVLNTPNQDQLILSFTNKYEKYFLFELIMLNHLYINQMDATKHNSRFSQNSNSKNNFNHNNNNDNGNGNNNKNTKDNISNFDSWFVSFNTFHMIPKENKKRETCLILLHYGLSSFIQKFMSIYNNQMDIQLYSTGKSFFTYEKRKQITNILENHIGDVIITDTKTTEILLPNVYFYSRIGDNIIKMACDRVDSVLSKFKTQFKLSCNALKENRKTKKLPIETYQFYLNEMAGSTTQKKKFTVNYPKFEKYRFFVEFSFVIIGFIFFWYVCTLKYYQNKDAVKIENEKKNK